MKTAVALGIFLCSAAAALAATDPQEAYTDALGDYKIAHYIEAEQACRDALAALPERPTTLRARIWVLQGRILTGEGNFKDAEVQIAKALAADPNDASAHRALGDLRFHQRAYGEARVAYLDAQRALGGKPDADLTLLLVYCALGKKDIGEALRLSTTLNAFDDQTPVAYFAQAAVTRFKGDEEAAAQTLQSAATVYGTQLFAVYNQDYLFLFASKQ